MICDLSGYEKLKTFFQFVGFLSCVEEIESVSYLCIPWNVSSLLHRRTTIIDTFEIISIHSITAKLKNC